METPQELHNLGEEANLDAATRLIRANDAGRRPELDIGAVDRNQQFEKLLLVLRLQARDNWFEPIW
jgi:hypothetical protein